MIRSKGVCWLATANDEVCHWSHAGRQFNFRPGQFWWGALDEEGECPPEMKEKLRSRWHPKWGDRATEVAIIGRKMDQVLIKDALHKALLTDEEFSQGKFKHIDPFCFSGKGITIAVGAGPSDPEKWEDYDDPITIDWEESENEDEGDESEGENQNTGDD